MSSNKKMKKHNNVPILIENGTVINAESTKKCNIYIENGIIKEISEGKIPTADNTHVIDATDLLIMPGGIDPHTHMQFPFMGEVSCDDFENGTKAAVAGGTTTIIDFAIPNAGESLISCWKKWAEWAEKSVCDYTFHVAVTWWSDEVEKEMEELTLNYGVNSFKHFLAYKGALMLEDSGLAKSFTTAKRLGALCTAHCENGELVERGQNILMELGITGPEGHPQSRPPSVEAEATDHVARFSETIGVPMYVVHCSCKPALDVVARGKREGQRIWAECLAGHLTIDDSVYYNKDWKYAACHVMSPPFRSPEHQVELWKGLQAGILSTVATDHCPFTSKQRWKIGKDTFKKIPNGCAGVEERMMVVWEAGVNTGRLSQQQFVQVTSTNAAKIFNMYPKKGAIEVGSDADIVVWDPKKQRTLSSKTLVSNVDINVFEGRQVTGAPVYTLSRGKIVYNQGKLQTERGYGKYVKRPCFGPVYDGIKESDNYNKPRKVERN